MTLHNPAGVTAESLGPHHKLLSTEDLSKPLPEGAEYWNIHTKEWKVSNGYRVDVNTTYRIPLTLSDRLKADLDRAHGEAVRIAELIEVVEAVEKGTIWQHDYGKDDWYEPSKGNQTVAAMEHFLSKGFKIRIKPNKPTPQTIPWTLEGTEAEVCADIAERQKIGLAKYGVSVADNPLTLLEWLRHSYEEKLDDVIYMKRAITELERNGDAAGQEVEG